MLNFASLFNQFRSQSNGGLNDLLEQPGLKMGRLLDEDSFLNEYKSSNNPKIQEFMKYERYEELVDFVTVVGPPDDKKRSYKYPLAACDLLCVDTPPVVDFFFPDEPITLSQTVTMEFEEEVDEKIEEEEAAPTEAEKVEPPAEQAPQQLAPSTEGEQKTSGTTEEKAEETKEKPSHGSNEEDLPKLQVPPKYRKVKVLRKVEKQVSRQVPPLIDRLMDYFKGEVNYTLAGYICKILSFLANKKPTNFLQYFLQQKFIEPVLSHVQSRSVGELITKVLVSECQASWQERKGFFRAMLNSLSVDSGVHVMSNLSACISEVMEKAAANLKSASRVAEFAEVFFSLEVMMQVIKNVISDEESVSVYNAPILLTFLTNVPFIVPSEESLKKEFSQVIELFVQSSCRKLNVSSQNHPKIGLGRTKIVEILRLVMKEDILGAKHIVAATPSFFPILLNLLRQYPLASLLHNEVVKVLEIALSDPQKSPLNSAILNQGKILEFIKEEVQEDSKIRAGESVYKSRKGFIAHLINLAAKIKELSETNSVLKDAIQSPEYATIYESFFQKEIFNSKRSLAGFLVKKDAKQHEIKFQKEDIIATYATFLRKCPPPVFEEVPPSADSHPDLIEELQKTIEETLVIKAKEEKKVESPKSGKNSHPSPSHPEQPKLEEAELSYDLDQLPLDW